MKGITIRLIGMAMLFCCLITASCEAVPEVAGDELINKAREDYAALDSARVTMTNMETGEVEQVFTFKYDEKDVLIYSCEGIGEGSEYAQYNNGLECYSYENGEVTHLRRGESGFNMYNRAATHPQADKGMILFSPAAVAEAEVVKEDGITHIVHKYDVDKIGVKAETGEVTGFTAEYFFDGDELLYFIESTETTENGEVRRHSYKIEIAEKNSVERIENTVKQYLDDPGKQ